MSEAVILNNGDSAGLFEERAQQLGQVMRLEVRSEPAKYNYVLGWEEDIVLAGESFIPFDAIHLASDKRLQAKVFARNGVATPTTYLLESEAEVQNFLRHETQDQWVLKWPTGCGGSGHRIQDADTPIPAHWPRPYLLQRFVRLDRPEVYRIYAVANETFGWNVRRFEKGAPVSPFVAHARGAHYETAGNIPPEAEDAARQALASTDLLNSFGCVDLLRDAEGRWLVLEVGTDGLYMYVDRDLGIEHLAEEIDERIADAFHAWLRERRGTEVPCPCLGLELPGKGDCTNVGKATREAGDRGETP